jgi:dihydroxyacetone synthase
MPNLSYIRPCDAEELIGAWSYALSARHKPSILSIARDPVERVPGTNRSKLRRGAYVVRERLSSSITLVSCGSNLHHAAAAAESLEKHGIKSRLVSAPCLDLFDEQDDQYRQSVLPLDGRPVVSVEEYVATTWARYVTASISMTTYGYSASNESNYQRFGLDSGGIERKVIEYLRFLNGGNARQAGWRQL